MLIIFYMDLKKFVYRDFFSRFRLQMANNHTFTVRKSGIRGGIFCDLRHDS